MYTQFFGNYLLSKEYITNEQLFDALKEKSQKHTKLGTLAIHSGLMTAAEVDSVIVEQTHQDKKFGELTIEMGYLTNEQVKTLLNIQSPDFLLLGQILLDKGIIDNTTLEKIIKDYRHENEISDLDMVLEDKESVENLIEHFFSETSLKPSALDKMYIELLFNSFIRFVGDDYTPLSAELCENFNADCVVRQDICGEYAISTYIGMNQTTAINFASRYVKENFSVYDEYVQASLDDFLNLNNGLFTVNCSNEKALELTLSAPEHLDGEPLTFKKAYKLKVLYPFGTVHFIIEF
ncbi:MAG: chemotaxis protein CheX [Agathobacter sp.]|uniref:chemotaxis protein CheX n=1 Tax=Agathobacter sp. TaxID=2021311 RepID=UPI002E778077|nr:chemotaxis protein CheX [Agathobacter sp.]MEE1216752.1 chemotaxis protein CheX [Agathobacter sp.]